MRGGTTLKEMNPAMKALQMQMANDELRKVLPHMLEACALQVEIQKKRYDMYLQQGFDKGQALQLVINTSVAEM